jgi:hypothetical protein
MKKVFFVLAFVAVYGVSLAMTNAPVVSIDETATVIVDNNDKAEKEEGKKATKAEAKSEAKGCAGEKSAKSEGCAGEKSAKKGDGCETKKTAEAKSAGGCGGK